MLKRMPFSGSAPKAPKVDKVLVSLAMTFKGRTLMGPLVSLDITTGMEELCSQLGEKLGLNLPPGNQTIYAITMAQCPCGVIDDDDAFRAALRGWFDTAEDRVVPVRRALFASLAAKISTEATFIGWCNERVAGEMGAWEMAVRSGNLKDVPDELLVVLLDQLRKGVANDQADAIMHALAALWMLARGPERDESDNGTGRGPRLRAHMRQRLTRLGIVDVLAPLLLSSADALVSGTLSSVVEGAAPQDEQSVLAANSSAKLLAKDTQQRKMSSFEATSLAVHVISAANLANADGAGKKGKSDAFVTVLFQGHVVGQTEPVNDDLDPVWEGQPPFTLTLPPGLGSDPSLPPGGLQLIVRDFDEGKEGDLLGIVDLSPLEINVMLNADDDEFEDEYNLQPLPLGAPPKKGAPDPNALVQGSLKVRLTFKKRMVKVAQDKQLEISIIDAAGLAAADKTGDSDPYCIIYWDGQEIGRTPAVNNTLAPSWEGQKFVRALASDYSDSVLTVEVRDKDKGKGKGEFLGQVSFLGKSIAALPTTRAEYPLVEKPAPEGEEAAEDMSLVQGMLAIRTRVTQSSSIDVSVPVEYMVGDKAECTSFTVSLCDALGLAKADKSGNSDPFVMVFFNDVLVGRSTTVDDNANPVWGNPSLPEKPGEKFVIALPGDTSACQVRLEVYDEDPRGLGDFLGQVSLAGPALAGLEQGKRLGFKLERKRNGHAKQKVQGELGLAFEMAASVPCTPAVFCVISAEGLPDMGRKKKSSRPGTDPWVAVYFNDAQAGMAMPLEDTLNPSWPEVNIMLPIPTNAAATEACELRLEMRHKGPSIGTLIGVRSWRGKALQLANLPQGQRLDLALSAPPADGADEEPEAASKGAAQSLGTVTVKFTVSGASRIRLNEMEKLRGWARKAKRNLMEERKLVSDSATLLAGLRTASDLTKMARLLAFALGLATTFAWERSSVEMRTSLATPASLASLVPLLNPPADLQAALGFAEGRMVADLAAGVLANLISSDGFDASVLLDPQVGGIPTLASLLRAKSRAVIKSTCSALCLLGRNPSSRDLLAASDAAACTKDGGGEGASELATYVTTLVTWGNGSFQRWVASHDGSASFNKFTLHFMRCVASGFWAAISLLNLHNAVAEVAPVPPPPQRTEEELEEEAKMLKSLSKRERAKREEAMRLAEEAERIEREKVTYIYGPVVLLNGLPWASLLRHMLDCDDATVVSCAARALCHIAWSPPLREEAIAWHGSRLHLALLRSIDVGIESDPNFEFGKPEFAKEGSATAAKRGANKKGTGGDGTAQSSFVPMSDDTVRVNTACAEALITLLAPTPSDHPARAALLDRGHACEDLSAVLVAAWRETEINMPPQEDEGAAHGSGGAAVSAVRLLKHKQQQQQQQRSSQALGGRAERLERMCTALAQLLALLCEAAFKPPPRSADEAVDEAQRGSAAIGGFAPEKVLRRIMRLVGSRGTSFEVKRRLMLALWCLAHDGNNPEGGEWLGGMQGEDGPSGRAVVVKVLAESASVIVHLVETCAAQAKAKAAQQYSPPTSQCAEAGVSLMYVMAFDGGEKSDSGCGHGACEALYDAGILHCAASCLEAFGGGRQQNERIVSLVLTTLLVLRSGAAAADAVVTATATEAALEAAAAAGAGAEEKADGTAFEASQAAMKAMDKKQRRRQHEPEEEDLAPPPPPPPSTAELADSAADAGGVVWAGRILESSQLPMLLLRTALNDAQGDESVQLSPAQVRNRILAAATILSLDSAPQHEGKVGSWAMSCAQDVLTPQQGLDRGGAVERKGSGLLPALASPAQLPHAHARLPLAGVSYPDVVAFLGGLLPLSRRNTPWGPGPGLRAQLRDRRFHRDQMVVALAIELLFARDPAIVQYGLVTLIWLSDERTAARRAIVEMGAVPRIVDLCRVRPDSVPRHITSLAITLSLSLADNEQNQEALAQIGIPVFVALLRDGDLEDAWEDRGAVCWLLEALRENLRNRTAFFKAELAAKVEEHYRGPPGRGEKRLNNWLQAPIQSAWTLDLDFMSRASVAQGCGAKITSPFLHHYGACPIFPEQLHSIMQTSPSPQRPSAPCRSDPPTLYRPRPPPAPLPGGHTVPVAEDDKGQFGKLPPQALQICVLATPRVLKKFNVFGD